MITKVKYLDPKEFTTIYETENENCDKSIVELQNDHNKKYKDILDDKKKLFDTCKIKKYDTFVKKAII